MTETIETNGRQFKVEYDKYHQGTSRIVYHITFPIEQPKANEVEDICQSIDYLWQSEIHIKGDIVIYTGYTD